jgi:hypothetical protein
MKPGDIVVCINDIFDSKAIELIPNRPKKDKIYTIRNIIKYPITNKVGVLVEEITNEPILHPNMSGLFEPTFDITRFAPILPDEVNSEINEYINELCQQEVS